MPSTNNELVEWILEKTESHELEWIDSLDTPQGGFVTKVGPLTLRLMGSSNSLVLTDAKEQVYIIKEPIPHFSQSPGGRIMSVIKHVKEPASDAEKGKETLRKNLIALRELVWKQTKYQREDVYWHELGEEMLQKIRKEDE